MPARRALVALLLVLAILSVAGIADARRRLPRRGRDARLAAQRPFAVSDGYDGDKKKPKKPTKDCRFVDLTKNMPRKFEPSDAVFVHDRLWVVSDDSRLLAMSPDGELLESVAIGDRKEFDLEAIAHDPSRPDFLYLGVEHPQQILEYSIEHKRVGRKWDLSEHFGDVPKNRGLEGLAYVPTERSATGGYFVAGVQHDSRLLLFDVDLAGTRAEAEAVVLVAEIQDQPGPDYDISAVSLRGHHLYLLFDSEREMTRVDLDEHHQVLLPVSKGADPSQLPFRIDALKITHAHYKFQILGLEGVAFSEQHAFFCIDPSDDSPKGIVRYDIEQLDRCFLDHGME